MKHKDKKEKKNYIKIFKKIYPVNWKLLELKIGYDELRKL